ncbi:MAG TPA: response regulator [Steroidobacteraceae bacterium]|jgi:signal transduction histidine kinase
MSAAPAARLLIVDDEVAQMRALCDTLEQEGYRTHGFTSGREALTALREQSFDLLLTDLMMPEIDGITLLRACREVDRDLACIVMTGHGTVPTAVAALKEGAHDYVLKPFKVNSILTALGRALGMRRLQLENIQLRESVSIYELARAITQGLTREEIIERTLAAAARQSDVAAAYVLVADPEGGSVRLAGSAGPGAATLERAPLSPDELGRWVALAVADLEAPAGPGEPRALFAHPFDARIGVALPIIAGGKLFAVLGFSSTRAVRGMSRGQLKALDVLARTAATALATAALVAELRRLNDELEQRVHDRTRDLEAANQDLESFSYSVSHDLREPLRVIEGFCEMFRAEFEASVPEPGRKILERVWTGARRMTQLINDLLHFSRSGRQPLKAQQVPLRELVLEIVARLREPLGERPLIVEVADLPDCFADRALLEQVLINLLSNAFKFSAGRNPARVEVGALRQGEAVVYYVRDNGVGFDVRHAGKLFGVFQRLHMQEAFEGTGIGLSIVHRIITRHGGRVWADSRPDEGTTLYFSLPPPRSETCAA